MNTALEERNLGGRPMKFKTPEELQGKIDDYFGTVPEQKWTWTGLALHLDTDKWTLKNYVHKDGFSASIKRAMLKVENAYELALRQSGKSGDIFALKNFGWRDDSRIEISGQFDISHVITEFVGREITALSDSEMETQPLLPDSQQAKE